MTLEDLFIPLRVLLKDNDTQQQENSDAMLTQALRAAWQMGLWPAGYTVAGDGTITPEPPVGMTWALIVMETAWFMVVGDTGAYSFSTRPISETDHGERKRDLMQYCRQRIYEARDAGAGFSAYQKLVVFLNTIVDAGDLATATVLGPLNMSIDYQGGGLSLTPPPPI